MTKACCIHFLLLPLILALPVTALSYPGGDAGHGDFPEVPRVDLRRISLEQFSDAELRPGWMTQPLPYYLAHFAEVANSIVTHGNSRGWINRRVWRGLDEFREQDPRVMENVLSLVFFYTRDEPWNPYYSNEALRKRLELAIDFYTSRMGETGLMNPRRPDQHVGFRLANSMFFTKFMGEALVLLRDGPPIDEDVHARLLDAQRRALRYVLSSDLAEVQGRQFSNQYGNVFSGAYAYLFLKDDPEIKRLLEQAIERVVPRFQSPAGYLYENHSVDFGYTLGTHHSNVHAAWHYAERAQLDTGWLKEETERWAEWLSYNAVPNADFSFFHLNRAIEGRQDRAGFGRANAPFARDVRTLRAFVASQDEVQRNDQENRAQLARNWPRVPRLGTSFTAFSPYAFLHRDHFEWYPTEEERIEARRQLPYLARNRFTHQRVDDRRTLEVTFIRRPGYYAIFNAGEAMSAVQNFGLGLVWHPATGAVLQSQTRLPEATWGVALEGNRQVEESDALEVRYFIDGVEVFPVAGTRDLEDGLLEIHYRLRGRNEKFLRFEEDRILVVVNPGDGFSERIPVLLAPDGNPVVTDEAIRIPRGRGAMVIRPEGHNNQSVRATERLIEDSAVGVVTLEGFRRFTYSISFEER